MVMKFYETSLYSKMKAKKQNLMQIQRYMRDILMSLEDLHNNQNIAHLDLKPENILIDENNHCVLSDFGLSRLRSYKIKKGGCFGTHGYIAPDMFVAGTVGSNGYLEAMDLWGVGCILGEMLKGERVFNTLEIPKLALESYFEKFGSPDDKMKKLYEETILFDPNSAKIASYKNPFFDQP
jgi:serine/threonine protein kinase